MNDNVILTVEQVAEQFNVSVAAVRRWVLAGELQPVARAGRGGKLFFSRGAVVELLEHTCELCGDRFRRSTLRQVFCSKRCRQRANRLKE